MFTAGMYGEGTMYRKGGMGGGGVWAQLRLGRALHLYGSIGASGSCTSCNPDDLKRADLRTSLGLQYYFLNHRRWAPFVRGSILYQQATFRDPTSASTEAVYRASQVGAELALGLEWRIAPWLALTGDIAYHGLSKVGHNDVTAQSETIPPVEIPGLAGVNKFDSAFNVRFGAAIRF
jgi:hypothetical protein